MLKIMTKNKLHYILISCYLNLTLLILFPAVAITGVSNTKHNLSVSGPGSIKATSETQICIFCHTPHNSSSDYPLWNHEISSATYTKYESPTLQSYSAGNAPPIDGFSKLCLGCHDGVIALGAIISGGNIDFGKMSDKNIFGYDDIFVPRRLKPGDYGYLGTDLSGGHPISIIFNAALAEQRYNAQDPDNPLISMKLKWPISDPYVKLYPTQDGYGIQCTSCHDPHGGRGVAINGVQPPPFWQKETYADVCEVCHYPLDQIPANIGH
jgi:hypothetical protein